MNERIKELAEQASTRIDPVAHDGVCWHFDREKFAELIVRECMAQCDNGNSQYFIAKHFGVEE